MSWLRFDITDSNKCRSEENGVITSTSVEHKWKNQ